MRRRKAALATCKSSQQAAATRQTPSPGYTPTHLLLGLEGRLLGAPAAAAHNHAHAVASQYLLPAEGACQISRAGSLPLYLAVVARAAGNGAAAQQAGQGSGMGAALGQRGSSAAARQQQEAAAAPVV